MSLNPQATRAAARAAEHGASSAVAGLAAATSRIASHGRAGDAAAARAVFDAMPRRDAVAWNAMLTAYARAGRPRAALALFAEMGAPDAFSLTAALSSAASLRCPDAGAQLHARLLRLGLRAPLPVGNALVAMYARCARADDAARAFREMRDRNALSWCSLLHAYVASGRMALARELFDEMPAGSISSVAWNTLLTGYSRSGNAKQCLLLFNEMQMSGLSCDGATLCILIGACMELPHPSTGFLVHKIVVQSVWSAIPEVNNSLISFYSKFSLLDHAVKIFKSMESRTVVSWNSLIDAYTRLGHIEQAAALFQSAPETNAISWTSMIGGFARNGFADEALALFVKMLTHEHIRPDDFTFGAVLHACATAASLASGRMIHGCALQSGYASYLYVANSLMDMYAKCGDVEGASNVFHAVLQKDTVSWNTMLFGFAINGWAKEAFAVYERMLSRDICPDEVTFTGLLTACSHSGLVEQGRTFFESMVSVHGLKPTPEHLACVLDMYARSGNIVKAIEMLDQYSEMVHMHSSDMHESLLSAYSSVHLDARIRRKVGSSMVSMEPVRDTGYVMLSNMLCATGQWKEAEVVRRAMAEHGVKKSPGCSWIQLKGDAKVFVSGVLLETDSPGLGKKKGPVLPSSLTQELQTSKETHLWAPIHTMKGGGCAGGLSAARSTGRGWWCIMRWAASVVCLGRGIWLRCRWLRFLHRRCLFCWAASVLRGHFRLGDSSAVRLLALLLKATNNYTFLSLVETEKQLLLLLRVSRSIGQHLYLVITLMLKLPMIGCFGYQCRPLYQRIQRRCMLHQLTLLAGYKNYS